jgi:hypothetical protein
VPTGATLEAVVTGGALCAACGRARPFGELLAFGAPSVIDGSKVGRIAYVCRPTFADMRWPLCTSRIVGPAAVHSIELAATLQNRRQDEEHSARSHVAEFRQPAHIRDYMAARTRALA